MGNSAGKENDINNLMHTSIVKDADLPKTAVDGNNAGVWSHVNERYWELEMNQFEGFDEFNFFRAVNPAFYCGTEERRTGITVGNQEMFEKYEDLYDACYVGTYEYDAEEAAAEGEPAEVDSEQGIDKFKVPDVRPTSCDANNLPVVEDVTNLKRLYMKAERNIMGYPLLPGVNGVDQLKEIEQVLVEAFGHIEGKLTIDADCYASWDSLKGKKLKKLNDAGIGVKPTDEYLKSCGILRWWPQGRGSAVSPINGLLITINEMEHFKAEWTILDGNFPDKFHHFFKMLNCIHKFLKRKQLGGFWKNPKHGFISVDPAKFGTMFICEVDYSCAGIPTYFSDAEITKDCDEVLEMTVSRSTAPHQGGGKLYTLRAKNAQWMAEDEQLSLLLSSINRLAQIDRSLYYSPKKEGDTLFNLAANRG